jgi:regulator of RNase E activity RraA
MANHLTSIRERSVSMMPVENHPRAEERAACALYPASALPSKDLVDRLSRLATSVVADAVNLDVGPSGLRAVAGLGSGQVVAGAAFTVRTSPGDNLVVHKALDIARPGEVLVVAAGGATDRATIGGLIGEYALRKGLVALVVDGAVRDVSELRSAALPIFALGVSPRGPSKIGSGALRCPVLVAGCPINDGDLIVGDADGVAVVPRARIEAVVAAAEANAEAEARARREIAFGTWERPWVDARLRLDEVPLA